MPQTQWTYIGIQDSTMYVYYPDVMVTSQTVLLMTVEAHNDVQQGSELTGKVTLWTCESVNMCYKTPALSKSNVTLFPGFGPNLIQSGYC